MSFSFYFLTGFQVIEPNKKNSKLTEDNLENKRRLERQASPQAGEISTHLESIAESSVRDDIESVTSSRLPSQPSQ